ncbi:histidine kinase [Kumtagia ephedrae]|jgi:hypothetical protein|uniref:Histidine kinase n=1 Tax=Kumtagia ephedrae TaxID=2116701 RepID=A0A2P7RSG8_9HYPH|nr:histidine kinase [Mesorhizobium ephedrae]PSJ53177.1 histidine kinase [Mesorhizobium ephedrae]
MPTLSRFLVIIGVAVALAYAAMYALVFFVEPRQGEMIAPVALDRLEQKVQPTQ